MSNSQIVLWKITNPPSTTSVVVASRFTNTSFYHVVSQWESHVSPKCGFPCQKQQSPPFQNTCCTKHVRRFHICSSGVSHSPRPRPHHSSRPCPHRGSALLVEVREDHLNTLTHRARLLLPLECHRRRVRFVTTNRRGKFLVKRLDVLLLLVTVVPTCCCCY